MRVQRRLVVVAAPDVVDPALAFDQELVDVGRGPADVRVRRPDVAFLVPTEAHAAAAWPADVAGGERQVHDGRIGPVVVVAPDQPLLVAEHRPAPLAAFLRLGDPVGRLDDVVGVEARDPGRFLKAGAVGLERLLEAFGAGGDEVAVEPAFFGDVGEERVEEDQVGAGVELQVQHPVRAGLGLAGGHRHGPARVDDDDPARLACGSSGISWRFFSSEAPRRFGTQWARK